MTFAELGLSRVPVGPGFRCPDLNIGPCPNIDTFLAKAMESVRIIGSAAKRQPSKKPGEYLDVIVPKAGSREMLIIDTFKKMQTASNPSAQLNILRSTFEFRTS